MAASHGPLFVARRAYRRRRLTDAARLWPILGLFLFVMPVLWQGDDGQLPQTAFGGLYLFAVWAGLILGAFVLARRLGRGSGQSSTMTARPWPEDRGE